MGQTCCTQRTDNNNDELQAIQITNEDANFPKSGISPEQSNYTDYMR